MLFFFKYVHRSCSEKLLLPSASQPGDQPTNQKIAVRVSGFISLEVWNLPDTLPCLTAPPPQMKDVWRNDFSCGITCPGWATGITVIELEIIFSHMHLEIAALTCFFFFFYSPCPRRTSFHMLSAVRAVFFFFSFFFLHFHKLRIWLSPSLKILIKSKTATSLLRHNLLDL